jgi:catechol 2,3-dioxygenase-like lactoylglutathione lyase family enzyme
MKRTIGFLATLMFAFVLAFGFVVNTASAQTIHTCQLSVTQPCEQVLDTQDELDLFFNNMSEITVTFQNLNSRQAAELTVTIGSQVQPPVSIPAIQLQPGQIIERKYPTINASSAVVANTSVLRGSQVRLIVTASEQSGDEPPIEEPIGSIEPSDHLYKIEVSSMDRAIDFYGNILEMERKSKWDYPCEWEPNSTCWTQFYYPNSVKIGLHQGNPGSGTAVITIVVKDIKEAVAFLRGKQVDVTAPKDVGEGVQLSFFSDPDDNKLALRQES